MALKNFNLTSLLLILLGILIMFLLLLTFKKPAIRLLGGYTQENTVIRIDTTYLPQTIDTVDFFNKIVEIKGINLNPDPIIKYVLADKKEVEVIDSTKNFNVQLKDSLIDGNLFITNDFKGNLLETRFNYKPLFPKYITKTIPYKVTETITKTVSNDKIKFGVGVGINTQSIPNLNIGIMDNKGVQYQIGYSKPDLFNSNTSNIHIVDVKIFKFF